MPWKRICKLRDGILQIITDSVCLFVSFIIRVKRDCFTDHKLLKLRADIYRNKRNCLPALSVVILGRVYEASLEVMNDVVVLFVLLGENHNLAGMASEHVTTLAPSESFSLES